MSVNVPAAIDPKFPSSGHASVIMLEETPPIVLMYPISGAPLPCVLFKRSRRNSPTIALK